MRYIDIKINDNYIQDIEYKELIGGSYKNDFCHFSFDKEWEEFKDKFAVFVTENGSYKKALIDNECDIPLEIFNEKCRFGIGVYGILVKGQDNLIKRNSTNLVYIRCNEGAYKEDLKEIEAVENESIYEQYISKMNEIYSKIKQEHEDIIEVIDNKEIAVKRNIDEYAIEKVKEYNENAIQKIEDYNTNAKVKKEEIDAVAEEVKKDRTYIEEIEKRVKISESNAKTSETNASTSEQNAQNSAENASKVLSDVTGIQEGINASKTHIDDQKVKVDKSVEDVEKLVDEATSQANISKANAELSTTNAGQVSADKNAVENMMNAVSTMKTSVEQTKSATEQIKTDTQGIYNNTVDAKNETLETKTEVENSLETERIESDKRYARAIESEEIVVDGAGQVELDEEGFMKDFSAEGNLLDITQEIREGYNLLNILGLKEAGTVETKKNITYTVLKDGRIEVNGTSTEYVSFQLGEIILEPGTYCSSGNYSNIFIQCIGDFNFSNNQTFTLNERGQTMVYLVILENSGNIDKEIIAPMITSNLANKPYEQYGVSPSLDYPSQFENITRNVNIQNNQRNFLDMSNAKSGTSGGVTVSVNSNGTYGYVGTATQSAINVWFFGGFFNTTPIFILKAGTYYCRDVRIYSCRTTLIGESTAVTLPEDTVITGVRAAQAKVGETYNEIKYPMIVKIEDKDMPYEPYNGYNEQLELSNDQFLGRFQGFENYIENTNLKGNLKIFTLDGTENISKHETLFGNLFRIPFTNYKKNEKILCTHFFGVKNIEERNENTAYLRDDENSSLDIITNLFSTTDEFRTFLSNEYNNNTPVQVLYITNEQYKEDLSTENVTKINSLKVYKGINNIYSNCKIRFKANKNLNKHIESRIKETVANEREISDSKYSRALKGIVEDTNFTQIYADNSKIDNLVIKGSQLKQETHTSTANILYSEEKYWEIGSLESTTGQPMENNTRLRTKEFIPVVEQEDYFASIEDSNYVWLNIHYYNSKKEFITTQQTITDNVNGNTNVSILPPQGTKYLKAIIRKTDNGEINLQNVSIAKTMIVKGTSKIDYIEGYPIMPSLDYPSETDLTTEQNIQDSQENILYIDNSDYKPGYTITSAGITFTVQDDLGLKCVGTATSNTKVNILGIYENRFKEKLDIRKGQKIYGYIVGEKVTGARLVLFSNNKYAVLTSTNPYVFQENASIGQVYAEVVANSIVDCVIYPQITYEKVDKFIPYDGYRKNIQLPQNEFNNSIGNFENEIKKIDGKWCLVKNIKELTLDGTEHISISSNGNVFRFEPAMTPIINNSPNTKSNAIKSNYFTNKTFDNLYNADVENGIELYNGLIQVRDSTLSTIEGWKDFFAEKYNAGTPVKICYATTNPEMIELPEETQQTLNSIELMEDLNNISIDNGMFSFEYNKSLARALEERDDKIDKLQAQYDEIMTLLSTTNTASILAENLAKDNESEVV